MAEHAFPACPSNCIDQSSTPFLQTNKQTNIVQYDVHDALLDSGVSP